MAGGQERILRRRIRSVQSTKKITRAMELIAATRVVRAQERAARARPYSQQITNVILDLVEGGADVAHPLLRREENPRRAAFVVITSDRGLCGAYNTSVIRAAEADLADRRTEGIDYSLILVGRKAASYFRFRHYRIDAALEGITDQPTFEDARALCAAVAGPFEAGEIDTVDLVYTRFKSLGSQEVVARRFLPLRARPMVEGQAELGAGYEYEPSPEGIVSELLPRYVEARLFAALLDSSASEHASRQRAMKAATDNAEDLIVELTRHVNRARQDSITTEIMEIAGGAEALAQAGTEDLLPGDLVVPELLPHDPDQHGRHEHAPT